MREDGPWREGTARIFPSLEYIQRSFTEFWRLLSYEAIAGGSLDAEFGYAPRVHRELHRVREQLFNADLPLRRNHLDTYIQPLIGVVFENIADQTDLRILKSCYVHFGSLRIALDQLNVVISDAIPQFLKRDGTEEIRQTPDDAGTFGAVLKDGVRSPVGSLLLLLGGIGSGKTTFLKRYQRSVGAELLEKYTMWFHVDFLDAPLSPSEMEKHVWNSILGQLRGRYASFNLESTRSLKKAFKEEIEMLKRTELRLYAEGRQEYENILATHLSAWSSDLLRYVPAIVRHASSHRERKIVLFIDNVDQLSSDHQSKVFMLAQRVARTIDAITIVSLREDSYYSASVQRTFTAYTTKKSHIASPRFRRLIGRRIEYALTALQQLDDGPFSRSSGTATRRKDIADFLRIVEYSIFSRNKNIARFVDAICFGNMRQALKMFGTFLTSGATDVDKMLRIHRRDGAYYVAFHEWVKSVILGDRQYYKESESPIMNLFDCGNDKNSSHFTGLRILSLLLSQRAQYSTEGQGYADIARTCTAFEDTFDNRDDFVRTLNRLVSRQLVEVNTRSTESIRDASHARITSAGWYYCAFLGKSFCYLDLMLQDTPLNDKILADGLKRSVEEVGNLLEKEEEKLERLRVRFDRVERFLDYLEAEEEREAKTFALDSLRSLFSQRFVPGMREQYLRERESILQRIQTNLEKYEQPSLFEYAETQESIFANGEDDEQEETSG